LENLFVGFIFRFLSTVKSVAQLKLSKDKMMKGATPVKLSKAVMLITKKPHPASPKERSQSVILLDIF
jgi:hypothetical protein